MKNVEELLSALVASQLHAVGGLAAAYIDIIGINPKRLRGA